MKDKDLLREYAEGVRRGILIGYALGVRGIPLAEEKPTPIEFEAKTPLVDKLVELRNKAAINTEEG